MIECKGLRGDNLLAFLAALGLLRTMHRLTGATMSWEQGEAMWYPVLHGDTPHDELPVMLADTLSSVPDCAELSDPNLKMSRQEYRDYAASHHDWGAAFASEACLKPKEDIVRKSPWIVIGAAKQTIVPTLTRLAAEISAEKFVRTLFEPWDYADKGCSLRLDPADQKDYALQWGDPSKEGAYTMHGACRLAIEALPLLPVIPTPRFTAIGISDLKQAIWPIWSDPLGIAVVRSLLVSADLAGQGNRVALRRRGVREVYSSRKVHVGKYTAFAPAVPW